MGSPTLAGFRAAKLGGFAGWETAAAPPHEGAAPYVEPVDARFGAPSAPVGAAGFERWCADRLAGDHHVVAGSGGALVYCSLAADAALLRRVFV